MKYVNHLLDEYTALPFRALWSSIAVSASMKLAIHASGKSDVGLVRTNNEDCIGFDLRSGIFVLSDGMGGQVAGEVASRIAVDTVMGYFRSLAL
jgi:serine/threonine protein phosphatase PrpC